MIRMIAAVRDVIVAAAIVLGGPVLLTAVAGPPIPHRRPTAAVLRAWLDDPLQPAFAAATARTIGWLVWAGCTLAVLACLAGQLRRLPARLRQLTAYLPPPVQGLTATMVGAAAVTTTTAAPAVAAALPPAAAVDTAPPVTGQPLRVTTPTKHSWHDTASRAHPGATAVTSDRPTRVAETRPRRPTCVVRRGDTLFDLATHYLGDGNRWPEIYRLNRGTSFLRVGGTLTDPDLIYPGWTLRLPHAATPSTGGPTAPRHRDTNRPATAAPTTPDPTPGGAAPASSAGTAPARSAPAGTAPTPPASPATRTSGDDGVAGPVATSPDVARGTSSGSTPTGSASASSRSAANRDDRAEDRGAAARGVALPGGSWIDLGLALAIVAAVALVWAQRRRRYTRRPPSADLRLDDPDLAPMPPVITQLRRRLRHPAPGDTVPTTSAASRLPVAIAGEEPSVEADPIHGDRRADEIDDLNDLNDPDDARDDIDVDQADEQEGGQPVSGDGRRPRPPVPALTHPFIEVWPPAGLGLIGPGATAAARGFLVAALAAGGVDDEPGARTRVVMPAVTANVLLGPAAATLPETPRLTVTAGLDAALDLLEAHTLHRTRLVYAHEVDDLAALRTADPYEEPLPPILLLADPTGRHQRRRIAALLAQGQRLDIHGILLAAWPDGTTVTVADDGATTPADGDAGRHSRHPADVGRLTVLDPTQTVDLIGTLAESHTGQPHPAAPADPDAPAPVPAADPLAPASTDSAPRPAPAIPDREPPTEPAPEDPREQGAAVGETPVPRPVQTSVPAGAPTNSEVLHQPDAADGDAAEPAPLRGRIGVTVLGRLAIIGADPHRPLRAKSLELLVYLAVHDGTASAETILDDLLPDAPASKALHRLHTYVSDLRAMLRATAGPGSYLTHTGQRYTLSTDRLDIDLWRLHAALRDADTADTRQERTAALRRAVTTYAGPLADGCDYEWVEPYREGARRQALDAALALADLLTDQPAEQLTVLEAALGHNPYAEPLYQAAMRAHATLGHLDAIRTLRRTLTRRLAEIDAEPTDASLTLADHLIADLQRPRAQSPLRQADRSGEGTAA